MAKNPDELFGVTAQDPNRVRTKWVDVKDPGLRQVLGIPEGGMPLDEFLGIAQAPAALAAPPVEPGAMTSLKRGFATSAGDIATSAAWATQAIPTLQQFFDRKAGEYKLEAESLPRSIARVEDIKSPGDFATWAWETLWEQVPFIASIALPGGVVGAGAKIAGASAKVAKAAGLTASFLADAGLMTGESIEIAQQNNANPNDLRVIGSGLGKAVLDFIPFWTLAKTVGIAKPFETAVLKKLAQAGYLKRAAGNAAVLIASEVPTETMQEVINNELDNYFTGYDGPITDEQKSALYNAAAGATLFGIFGAYAPQRAPDLPPPAPEPITDKSRLLQLQPKTDFTFESVPVAEDVNAPSGFDFRNLYDKKTGELRTTKQDYMRIVQEQMTVKYDPLSDSVTMPPLASPYTVVTPGWSQQGSEWLLDAPEGNPEKARAKITQETVPGPQGWTQGFAAYDVYGNSLGTYPTLVDAENAAQLAVYKRGKTYVFDETGMHIDNTPSGHDTFMQSIGGYLNYPSTPIEIAAQQIEQARPKAPNRVDMGPVSEEQVSEVSQDAELMRLLDARAEFLNNKDNYRTTDGEMKNAAAARLRGMDERIARLAKLKGRPNPNESETVSVVGEKIEETLGDIANEETAKQEAPKYPNLTAFEAKQYEDLEQKDLALGLSDQEYETVARLKQKMQSGVDYYGEYRPATTEEVQGFSAEENALLKKVRKHRAKYSKATRAIMAMRGIKQSKGQIDGRPVATTDEALKALSDGDQVFVFHEQDDAPTEVRDAAVIEKYAPDRILVVPRGSVQRSMGSDWKAAAGTPLEGAYEIDGLTLTHLNAKDGSVLAEAETEGGKIFGAFKELNNQMYSLGTFRTFEEALRVVQGASPGFVSEVTAALKRVWETFPLRPNIQILSTADIISGKGNLLPSERASLLASHGIFAGGTPGRLYIHIDQHADVEGTVKTLIHEMIVHFGLKAVLPKPYYDAILLAYADHYRDRIKYVEQMGLSENAVAARKLGKDRLADILSADEAIAYYAQETYKGNPLKPFEQNFFRKVTTTIKQWLRWIATRVLPKEWQRKALEILPFNDNDVTRLLIDTAAEMRVARENVDTSWTDRNIVQSRSGHMELEHSVDSFMDVWTNRAAGLFLQPLQMAERYNLPFVADYMKFVQKWAARKAMLQDAPVELVEKWQNYGKRKSNRLAEALFELTSLSDQVRKKEGRALTSEERMAVLKEKGVTDPEGLALYEEIRQSFKRVMQELEPAVIRNVVRRETKDTKLADELLAAYRNDSKPQAQRDPKIPSFAEIVQRNKLEHLNLGARVLKIASEMRQMQENEYFPYMRFGKYAIVVKAKTDVVLDGQKFKPGQMVEFQTFESYREMSNNLKDAPKLYNQNNFSISTGKIQDEEFSMLGMPPALYDLLGENLKLTEEQKERLKQIYYTKSPGHRFLRNMVNRRKIRGFSTDAIRVYANYMLNAANHIARIEHSLDMEEALIGLRKLAQDDTQSFVAGQVSDYWHKHYSYIMNPENDWAGLRAMGFLWYLGFNVKSAVVNLTQVPMVAYPFLGAKYGDAKALAAIQTAYRDTFSILKGSKIPKTELEEAIKWGIEEGFLDESLATVLAGFSESSVLQRIAPETEAQRRLNQVMWAGSWMFRHVEKINRYVTFLAARKLAMDRGLNEVAAREAAKEAVQSSMFEYAKWNRAEFMRGKQSVFFLFWSYMQGLAYLMGGGKGKKVAIRVWLMMLLAAGYQGIPFADNILDLLDWGSRETKEALGMKNPYTDLRTELRELAQTITDNPDFLLHGWSKHHGLGPIHLLSLAGVPVPEVDLSGSLGVGRWLPGTDKLLSTERDPDKKLGQTLVDVLGPVAGVGYGFFRALVDENPNDWKTWERAMPSALRGASQAARRMQTGQEEFRGGGAIATWDPNNPEDRAGLVLNMLAFQPSKLSTAYQVIGAKENLRRYWTGRQAMVMENYAFAKRSDDPELMADARAAMEEFNESVPDPRLRITKESIRRSMKARAKRIKERESGLPQDKGYRRLYEEIDRIYGLQ